MKRIKIEHIVIDGKEVAAVGTLDGERFGFFVEPVQSDIDIGVFARALEREAYYLDPGVESKEHFLCLDQNG